MCQITKQLIFYNKRNKESNNEMFKRNNSIVIAVMTLVPTMSINAIAMETTSDIYRVENQTNTEERKTWGQFDRPKQGEAMMELSIRPSLCL